MSDSFTEVTTQNYFQGLFGSIIGAFFGLALFVVAIGLLGWNESRAVTALRGLGEAGKIMVETNPAPIDPSLNHKLVHLTGAMATSAPLVDPALGMSKAGLVRLKRYVEMYQWKQSEESSSSSSFGGTTTTTKTYTYSKTWSEDPIDSGHFRQASGHQNPPMPFQTRIVTAQDATLGPRQLAPTLLDELDGFEALSPPANAPDGFQAEEGSLYRGEGSPSTPRIGDVRVTFSGVPVQTVSVLAEQNGASLAPFRTHNGYKVGLVETGDVAADQMLSDKRADEKILTWILRVVGFFLFFFSLLLIASPLSALANVIPFIASIVGASTFVFALGLSIPLTLITIAFAWVAVRPLFGIGLLVVAVLLILAYKRLRPRRVVAAPQSTGLQGGAPA